MTLLHSVVFLSGLSGLTLQVEGQRHIAVRRLPRVRHIQSHRQAYNRSVIQTGDAIEGAATETVRTTFTGVGSYKVHE